MGVTLSLTLQDLGVERGLLNIERTGQDQSDLMRLIGAAMELSVSERFEKGEGPDGPWLQSHAARERGRPTLVESARLRDSIVSDAGPNFTETGTNVHYGSSHQFGATIVPVNSKALQFRLPNGQFVTKGEVTLPARPFLGFSDQDKEEISEITEDYFAGQWQ